LTVVSYVNNQLSKAVPWHTSVHQVTLGVPQDYGCNIITEKRKYTKNFV